MEFTILEILYFVLTITVVVIGTLLSVILWKVLKIVNTLEEITQLYNQVKEILALYRQIPNFVWEAIKNALFGKK